ncbi:MAG: TlyA family RNA methyltransferase [Proteobacteria bacterium]|nr:TlyA family RNA methyltransferase [Pseudomonadota bacterium]
MKRKTRIDKLLFERGLASSRERAQAYLMAGKVLVDERRIDKPGTKVDPEARIRLKGVDHPYVSRGGLKLEKAIGDFGIEVRNRIAMDIGASTGGFTDCLLQHGAVFVFAVDVGYGQLAWKLATDSRVKNLEKSNFRYLVLSDIGTFVDLIVVDVSFISLTKVLENCYDFLITGGNLVALIKPQFEAGRKNVRKGGLVSDLDIQQQVVESVEDYSRTLGFIPQEVDVSPIQGKKSGNREFLLHLLKP